MHERASNVGAIYQVCYSEAAYALNAESSQLATTSVLPLTVHRDANALKQTV